MSEPIGLAAVRAGAGLDIADTGIEDRERATLARRCLHDSGYYPLPVENPVLGYPKSGKAPVGRCWQIGDEAPECVFWDRGDAGSLNTGILCAGLRARSGARAPASAGHRRRPRGVSEILCGTA